MLNAGLFASSSSLVIVPDLSGLSSSEALSALSNAELTIGVVTTTGSGANSSNNNKIASQAIVAGSLVERYSAISYSLYSYSAPPPPEPPPGPTGQYYCRTRSFSPNATSGIFTSSTDVSGYGCNPDGTPDYSTACVYSTTSADPGTPSQPICSAPPPPACTPYTYQEYGAWGPCYSGTMYRDVITYQVNSDCSVTPIAYQEQSGNCSTPPPPPPIPTPPPPPACGGSVQISSSCWRITRADCTSYVECL